MFNSDLFMEDFFNSNSSANARNNFLNEIQMPSAILQNNIGNMHPAQNMKPAMSLFSPKEAYEKGILFANLYDQYKDYKPATLIPKDEKEKLFLELSEMAFAAHELNLYLDVHPEDDSMIALFNDYRRKQNQLMEQYESKYGPMNIMSDSLNATPWSWTVQKWPWEGRGV